MNRPYLLWAIIGMLGYSFTALFVKLSTASGRFSSFLVLAMAGLIVFPTVAAITLFRGDIKGLAWTDFATKDALFALATAVALTVAVSSFFLALSLGPASVVVPIYGMFIVGGAVLGLIFLHEPLTLRTSLGILLAIASIYLIAGNPKP
jgi:bacterial/archaeal transporter family protein